MFGQHTIEAIKQLSVRHLHIKTNLPRDVGFPAAPRLTQMLQDGSGLVLFDTFRHHVQDVMHHLNEDETRR